MIFSEFVASIKGSMEQYNSAGLIDDMSVYDWMIQGMNEISILPTIRIEQVIPIKNNKGRLPEGFKSLYSAVKCEPMGYTIDEEPAKDILTDIHHYRVRETHNQEWNNCNPCEVTTTDSCIVEKVYLRNGSRANYYYNNLEPIKLNITSFVKKTKCDKDCLNFSVQNPMNEISINQKMVYTNFKEGNIFIVYNGYEEDDEGFVIIPETEENNLEKFITAYVKKQIIRKILENSDATTNEQFLYSLYEADVNKYQARAVGEFKMKKVLSGMKNYQRAISREFEVYNFGQFSRNQRNRIEFIVR